MRERIRVLHCLSSVASGGVERRRLVLARQLDKSVYEQRLLARAVRGQVVADLEAAGTQVMPVGQGRLFDPKAMLRAARQALAWRPHIVHGAVFEGLSLALVAGRASGARVVIEETSHAVNRSPRGHALFRALVAASDACVAISPAVGEFLVSATRVPREKITVISNGVEAPELPPPHASAAIRASLGIAPNAFVVGTVARLMDDSHKRVSDLIRATAELAARHPDMHLLVVGDGSARGGLEQLASTLGLRSRVTFSGSREDVGNLYSIMDVFALVSAREGFGLVVPEAMLCGLPVVATAVGGLVDIVVERETGLLVPPFEPSSISRAIEELHASPALRHELGSAGRLRAQRYFSAERYAADVDSFYRQLLSRRSAWSRATRR